MNLLIFQPFVTLAGKPGPKGLDKLGDEYQYDNRKIQHSVSITLITVRKCQFTQTAAANRAGHGCITHDGGYCQREVCDQ